MQLPSTAVAVELKEKCHNSSTVVVVGEKEKCHNDLTVVAVYTFKVSPISLLLPSTQHFKSSTLQSFTAAAVIKQ